MAGDFKLKSGVIIPRKGLLNFEIDDGGKA